LKYAIQCWKVIVIFLAATVLTACGAQRSAESPPESGLEEEAVIITSEQILSHLRSQGIDLTLTGPSAVGWLSAAPGAAYQIGEEQLYIHTYPNEAAALAAAATIPPSADNGLMDWVDTPHFFRCAKVIVLYLGKDQRVLDVLATDCGPPFASQ
jgi:hypothetical protein